MFELQSSVESVDVAVSYVLVTGATAKVIPARCFQCRAVGGGGGEPM